jgi:carbon-monoxide dehydrogenase medium subunit
MYHFDYHRAGSVDEASKMLAASPDAKLLAGGMSLLPMLKLRLAQTSDIIDLCDIADLRGIEVSNDSVVIRAMTTHATVAASKEVGKAIRALAGLANGIGDPHCRNRGTLGGSLAHNDPAACYPSSVLALNATIQTNRRKIAADDFFSSSFETALEPDELITSVIFPIPSHAAYAKFPQPASRFSLVGVFVAKHKDGVRVAVTGSAAKVFRLPEFEQALSQRFEPNAIDALGVSEAGLSTDIYGDPEYRAHLIKVLTARAVATATAQEV